MIGTVPHADLTTSPPETSASSVTHPGVVVLPEEAVALPEQLIGTVMDTAEFEDGETLRNTTTTEGEAVTEMA